MHPSILSTLVGVWQQTNTLGFMVVVMNPLKSSYGPDVSYARPCGIVAVSCNTTHHVPPLTNPVTAATTATMATMTMDQWADLPSRWLQIGTLR